MGDSIALAVKDAGTGASRTVRVSPAADVAALKLQLLREGVAPAGCRKIHLAHNGRLLSDHETCDGLSLVPTVVMAVLADTAPAPATPGAATTFAASSPPPATTAAAAAATTSTQRPSAVARAWDRAFPSSESRGPAPEEAEERMCRVCFCGEEVGRLFVPCRCRGSMKYVHPACLNEWRATSVNARSFTHCDQCGYRYQTERTKVADLLQSERAVWTVSFLLVAAVALAGSLCPGRPERLLFAVLEWEPSGSRASERACVALLWPGVLGAAFSMLDAYRLHRGIPLGQQGWLSALVLSFAANGKRLSRVLVACGLVYFMARLAGRLRQYARRLLTRFGEVILEVTF